MKKIIWIPIVVILLLGVGFLYFIKTPSTPFSEKVLTTLGIPMTTEVVSPEGNPASRYCEKNGGTIELSEGSGGKVSLCHLFDGTTCEAGAYLRHLCGTPNRINTLQNNISPNNGTTPANRPILNNKTTPTNGTTVKNETTVSKETTPNTITPNTTSPTQDNGSTPSVTATTGPSSGCSLEYIPVCANVKTQCEKAPCPVLKQTFANMCMMKKNTATTFLYEGTCASR